MISFGRPHSGSSPRLRGTPKLAPQRRRSRRIIPALAGNTLTGKLYCTRCGDHPRACGEHRRSSSPLMSSLGSSPRLRGTRHAGHLRVVAAGIIPALAGNTSWRSSTRPSPRDHPRACGEHSYAWRASSSSLGSSPRLRGTRGRRLVHRDAEGIIPALAGNTRSTAAASAHGRDHPRACGEHRSAFPPKR